MDQTPKKKSLFSQKIKEARKNQPHQQSSFPKAITVDLQESINPPSTAFSDLGQLSGESFSSKMLQSVLKKEEADKIHQENMNSIRNMSEEQIAKYQAMIMKDMSPEFIKKLKKSAFKMEQTSEKHHQKVIQANRSNHMRQELEQDKNQSMMNQGENLNNSSNNSLGCLNSLEVNIKTGQLTRIVSQIAYFPSNDKSQSMSIAKLKLLVESENNQSQIIACKLIDLVCRTLYSGRDHAIPVVKISGEHFHLVQLALDIFDGLVKGIMFQVRKTNFKSCWIELTMTLASVAIQIHKYVRQLHQRQAILMSIIECLTTQLGRCSKFFEDPKQSSAANLSQKVGAAISILSASHEASQAEIRIEYSIECSRLHPGTILQQIRLEQFGHTSGLEALPFDSRLQTVSKCIYDQHKPQTEALHKSVLQFVYPLALELHRRDLKSNNMSNQQTGLKAVLWQWVLLMLEQVSTIRALKAKSISPVQEKYYFQCLYVSRVLSIESYTHALVSLCPQSSPTEEVSVSNEWTASMLTLLNLEEYTRPHAVASKHQFQQQVESVQQMILLVTARIKSDSANQVSMIENQTAYLHEIEDLVLVLMLKMFAESRDLNSADEQNKENEKRNNMQLSYQDVNEQLMEALFTTLCQQLWVSKKHLAMWEILPQEQVKQLISSYNYSSFGNYCFTRVLLFLMATCPSPGLLNLILDQVVSRYPFLFYDASQQHVYGEARLYEEGKGSAEMKAIYDMLVVDKEIDQNNIFIKFLTRSC